MRNVPGMTMLAVAAVLALGACSPSKEQPSDLPPGTELTPSATEQANVSSQPSSSTAPPAEQGPECAIEDVKVSGEPGKKPTVTIPDDCAPPTKLLTKEVQVGSGTQASKSSSLQVNYQLVTWSDGKVVDGSYDSGQPRSIDNLGQAQLIEGWKQGLVGIKEGARRLLVIPPELGYGAQGKGPIKPDETLVFVVDAVSVTT